MRRAFSLLEIILAVAVSGMLLTFVMFHIVSLSNIWLNSGDNDFFQQHAEGVTVFLNSAFAASEAVEGGARRDDDAEVGETRDLERDSTTQARAIEWSSPPGEGGFTDPLLTFRLKEVPGVMAYEGDPLPGITAYLKFERGQGLALIWHSRLETIEQSSDLRTTLLSQFVDDINYAYYDAEDDSWREEPEPYEDDGGRLLLPDFLKLTFIYQDEEIITTVHIPMTDANVPLF